MFAWKDFTINECGIEFGESKSELSKTSKDYSCTTPSCFYNLGDKFGELTTGKTYYFRMYVKKDGRTFNSDVYSFVAGNGNYTFVDYSKVTPVISKPGNPSINANVSSNIPTETPVTIAWSATSYSTGYKVYVNDNEVQYYNQLKYAFMPSAAGTYTISVKAYNSKYSSDMSNTVTITAHATSTVSFLDWDGTLLNTHSVKYGDNAIAPDVPTRKGYTFTGWDKLYDRITQSTTITATYKKISTLLVFLIPTETQ